MIKDVIIPILITLLFAIFVQLSARVYELHSRLDILDEFLVEIAKEVGNT